MTPPVPLPTIPRAAGCLWAAFALAIAPVVAGHVADWADAERILSSKGSAEAGQWRTERNPPTREPMNAFSVGSGVHEVTLMWPIQFAKTEVALNTIGYTMCRNAGPVMVCLPGEVSLNKWVAQKLQPMLDESPTVRQTLTSIASREAANSRTFKDYAGGQLYIEHAGSPSRLKSTTVRTLIVDELDEFAANLTGGDDPVMMLDGRTSAYPGTYQRLYISSPQIKGQSRIEEKWLASDQRHYHVPCPHCGHCQPLEWAGLRWSAQPGPDGRRSVHYVCRDCGALISERHKTAMIAAGQWVPTHPHRRSRGYHINCLYYAIGLGPRWADLVELWLSVQGDRAKLKVFLNDRLALPWEDETTRRLRDGALEDAAEPYALRTAPAGVLCITAGIDTQDDRLAVHIVGWGRNLAWWVIDYVELPGDPSGDAVWDALTGLLATPIPHARGGQLRIDAFAQDAGGHKTEDVKAFVRGARLRGLRRPLCIFGAVPNNAPILKRGATVDITWRGQTDKRGLPIWHVGTVAAKHWLYGRLAHDAKLREDHQQALRTEEASAQRQARDTASIAAPALQCHFSASLPEGYYPGLLSEVFNPSKGRYEKKRGHRRNEVLDTLVYALAAAYHPELRLHRASEADWAMREAALSTSAGRGPLALPESAATPADAPPSDAQAAPQPPTPSFAALLAAHKAGNRRRHG